MIIPNYLSITKEQYEELLRLDPDDAWDLAGEWVEAEVLGKPNAVTVVDIDKRYVALAEALSNPLAVEAVNGSVGLGDVDDSLFVADPTKVAAMAKALAESTIDDDDDFIDEMETLTEFYTAAAENGHAVAVLYN
ncbi:DUF1877 family protein [Corynebacterium mayonis]|uniref:DUF1877 family protein n=1 Tax=Corynebacterium mayonis TaxID=3062461 RepID=UPI003140BD77